MALTKVQKTGITDNAIDADKIEDGTIVAADIAPGTITNAKLAGSIANDKLANSSITVNGSSVSLGGSVSAGKVQWQSVVTADGSTATSAVAGNGYFIDTTSNAHTINLPGSPSAGDTIAIKDYAGTFGSNNLTIGRNGNNIQGAANDSLISTNRASVVLVYIDATKGWLFTNESNVADLGEPLFTVATGGTITTSGDFKIHTFTGDGCFVVSQVGNPAGGPAVVDYLVVAGGGGGGAGSTSGGGAGGFRESHSTPVSGCYTASPLATPTGITVSATTYPISVGSGGAGSDSTGANGSNGSNSIFSTITSAGGGGGGSDGSGAGSPGGSGGGGANGSGPGSGNTPPVSPPQGNNGGGSSPGTPSGGGGGGAGAAGACQPSNQGIAGGAGVGTLINPATGETGPGPSQYYSGGGASGTRPGSFEASGGIGGGGNGGSCDQTGTDGTANTGGGGGSGRSFASPPCNTGRSGGSGIVIIRYKYQ